MEVYLVSVSYDGNFGQFINSGMFSTEEKAKNYINDSYSKDGVNCKGEYNIEVFRLDSEKGILEFHPGQ